MYAELFYCPYCGEEDLYPGDGDGWHCTSCLRSFVVTVTAFGPLAPHPEPGKIPAD
jgi:hypothetical protein